MEPAILFSVGTSILDTSSTSTISQTTIVSGAAILTLAWVACAIVIITGRQRANNRVFASGIIGAGIMTVATPLAYYVTETLRLGVFPASVQDFLLLAVLSALGGGIVVIGVLRIMRRQLAPRVRA